MTREREEKTLMALLGPDFVEEPSSAQLAAFVAGELEDMARGEEAAVFLREHPDLAQRQGDALRLASGLDDAAEGTQWSIVAIASPSLRAAAANANIDAYSYISGRPAPVDLVVSAEIDSVGQLLPTGGLDAKLKAIQRERPVVTRVAASGGVWAAARPTLIEVQDAAQLLALAFGDEVLAAAPEAVTNLETNLNRGVLLCEKESAPAAAAALLEHVIQHIDARRLASGDEGMYRREELIARWRGAAARCQLGDTAAALALVEDAAPLAETLWRAERLEASS